MTSPIYNSVQQVFALNMFSNFAGNKKAPVAELQADLTKIINALLSDARMQKYIGNWQVVWGPVVGSYGKDVDRQVASNALYVAKNDEGTYVIATAATNPISTYGWLTEDFEVQTMVVWDGFNDDDATAPRVSSGTNTGLNHLLGMESNGVSLITFLQNTFQSSNTKQQLIVTGHSLGGALSPTLALKLVNTQSQWNPTNTVVVCAQPSAGASPGNLAFSNYYSSLLGNRTLRFWNKLDPVPHGWQHDMLESAPFLYYPYYTPNVLLQGLVALALGRSLKGTEPYPAGGLYTQLLPQTPPLPGQVNIILTQPLPASTVIQFLMDMELKKILANLGITGLIANTIISICNSIIQHFDNSATVDDAIDWMRHELEKIFGHNEYLNHLFNTLDILLNQFEGVLLYLLQLGYQHVTTYYDLMDMKNMKNLTDNIINSQISSRKLDSFYLDLTAKLTDPKEGLKTLGEHLNASMQQLLTTDFIKQAGIPSIPTGVAEPMPL